MFILGNEMVVSTLNAFNSNQNAGIQQEFNDMFDTTKNNFQLIKNDPKKQDQIKLANEIVTKK